MKCGNLLSKTAVVLLLVGVFATGCASQTHVTVKRPITRNMEAFHTANVVVSPEGPATAEERAQLLNEVQRCLEQLAVLDAVRGEGGDMQSADLSINCDVVSIVRVSGGNRFLWGGLAGRAVCVASVKVIITKTSECIGEATVTGMSSTGTIFAGTTAQAIRKTAHGVADFIMSAYKPKKP